MPDTVTPTHHHASHRPGLAIAVLLTALLTLGAACGTSSTKASRGGSAPASTAGESGALSSGSSHHDSSKAFVDGANKACEQWWSADVAADEKIDLEDERSSREWAVTESAAIIKNDKAELDAFDNLTPPAELRSDWKKYLQLLEETLSSLETANHDAINSDERGYNSANADRHSTAQQEIPVEKKLGLDACAGDGLSASDAAAADKVVKKVYLTTEPSLCTDDLTPGNVQQDFGSLQTCEQQQTGQSKNSPSLDVTDTHGAGDAAFVDFTFQPSPDAVSSHPELEGQTEQGEATLFRQDGRWRIQHVDVKPPSRDTSS